MVEVRATISAGARVSAGKGRVRYWRHIGAGDAEASSGRATGRRRLERGRDGKRIPSSRIGSATCTTAEIARGAFGQHNQTIHQGIALSWLQTSER